MVTLKKSYNQDKLSRQDQLVLQMIRLMDNLLKEDKLDLRLTPYSVLATNVSDGFVQYVKATPIADLKGGILVVS